MTARKELGPPFEEPAHDQLRIWQFFGFKMISVLLCSVTDDEPFMKFAFQFLLLVIARRGHVIPQGKSHRCWLHFGFKERMFQLQVILYRILINDNSSSYYVVPVCNLLCYDISFAWCDMRKTYVSFWSTQCKLPPPGGLGPCPITWLLQLCQS